MIALAARAAPHIVSLWAAASIAYACLQFRSWAWAWTKRRRL